MEEETKKELKIFGMEIGAIILVVSFFCGADYAARSARLWIQNYETLQYKASMLDKIVEQQNKIIKNNPKYKHGRESIPGYDGTVYWLNSSYYDSILTEIKESATQSYNPYPSRTPAKY